MTFADFPQWKVNDCAVLESTSPLCSGPFGEKQFIRLLKLGPLHYPGGRVNFRATEHGIFSLHPIMETPALNSTLKITVLGPA